MTAFTPCRLTAQDGRETRVWPGCAVDLFAGAGGWHVAAQRLGIHTVGVEFNADAAATLRAAGGEVIETDVRALNPAVFAGAEGVIASPPCQTFSTAGKGSGASVVDLIAHRIRSAVSPSEESLTASAILSGLDLDERTMLVCEPLRWVDELRPQWVALEQVVAVQPVWDAYADVLTAWGYNVWTGILKAEEYGVPQTRRRAVLLASTAKTPNRPKPCFQAHTLPEDTAQMLFDLPPDLPAPVSVEQALGWKAGSGLAYELARGRGITERHGPRPARSVSEPAPTITGKVRTARWVQTNQRSAGSSAYYRRPVDQPSPTITGNVRSWNIITEGSERNRSVTRSRPCWRGKS